MKTPQKVAYLAEISSFQKFSFYCPTAQMAEFMFPNVAYRATVYRTGGFDEGLYSLLLIFVVYNLHDSIFHLKRK